MSLAAGARLGPYQVLGSFGAGGMGEVYKARDTRLDRTVAIKVLPDHVSDDPVRRARFEREAKSIAGLTHPNVCTLHDVGEHAGSMFLVMELLDGETLAHRLEKGPLPIEQALTVATAIADALSAAHRHGIIHRDLKPSNVMLTKAGAKLLDFGLAKLAADGDHAAISFMSATRSAPLTGEGVIVGTLQYMAPEQLEGKPTDARTDLWAFGAVVYEMLTGKRAFEATSAASLMGAILEHDPVPAATLQPLTPPRLDSSRAAVPREGARRSMAVCARPGAGAGRDSINGLHERCGLEVALTLDHLVDGGNGVGGCVRRWHSRLDEPTVECCGSHGSAGDTSSRHGIHRDVFVQTRWPSHQTDRA